MQLKSTLRTIGPAACAVLLLMLSGCGAQKTKPTPEMVEVKEEKKTLMERFEEGSPLFEGMEPSPMPWHSEKAAPDVTVHVNKGREYELAGKNLLAYNSYAKALALDPELISLRLRMGEVLLKEMHNRRALGEFHLVLEKHPDQPRANLGAGIAYFRSEDYDNAAVHFTKALEADKELDQAHTYMGMIHNYKRRFPEAAESFHNAALIKPGSHENFNNLGLTYYLSGQYKKAVAAYNEALRLGSPKQRTCNNLAMALYRLGFRAESLEAFKCAGDEAAAYNNFAYLHFLDGEYDTAEAYFRKAIEVNPIFYLRAHENLKRVKSAKALGAHAPSFSPGSEQNIDVPAEETPVLQEPKPFTGASADGKNRPETAPEYRAHVLLASLQSHGKSPTLPRQKKFAGSANISVAPSSNADAVRRLPYKLMVGSWETVAAAERHKDLLTKDGFNAEIICVELPELGIRHRVVIGAHATFQAAHKAKERILLESDLSDICVIRFSAATVKPLTGAQAPSTSSKADHVVAETAAVARNASADDIPVGENLRSDTTPRGPALAL